MSTPGGIGKSSSGGDAVDNVVPTFAPGEPTDRRPVGSWETRYSAGARKQIRLEASYVTGLFVLTTLCILFLAMEPKLNILGSADLAVRELLPFLLAFFGGMFGGTLFSMKWLYHSVARGLWNADRRLWRLFTPLLSAGAAVGVVVLSAGSVIPIFNERVVRSPSGALGISIIAGYFSDRAFSALERLAEDRFGMKKAQHEQTVEASPGNEPND